MGFSLAIAFALDVFSASLALSIYELRFKRKLYIAFVIALFHGVFAYGSTIITEHYAVVALRFSGYLLLFLSLQMLWRLLLTNEKPLPYPRGVQVYRFAILLSIDSLSIGTMPNHETNSLIIAVTAFSGVFAFIGLTFGTWLHIRIGKLAEWVSLIILFFLTYTMIAN